MQWQINDQVSSTLIFHNQSKCNCIQTSWLWSSLWKVSVGSGTDPFQVCSKVFLLTHNVMNTKKIWNVWKGEFAEIINCHNKWCNKISRCVRRFNLRTQLINEGQIFTSKCNLYWFITQMIYGLENLDQLVIINRSGLRLALWTTILLSTGMLTWCKAITVNK